MVPKQVKRKQKIKKYSVDNCRNVNIIEIFSRRAKEKRLKKDAGRARWGQYFRYFQGTYKTCQRFNKFEHVQRTKGSDLSWAREEGGH